MFSFSASTRPSPLPLCERRLEYKAKHQQTVFVSLWFSVWLFDYLACFSVFFLYFVSYVFVFVHFGNFNRERSAHNIYGKTCELDEMTVRALLSDDSTHLFIYLCTQKAKPKMKRGMCIIIIDISFVFTIRLYAFLSFAWTDSLLLRFICTFSLNFWETISNDLWLVEIAATF